MKFHPNRWTKSGTNSKQTFQTFIPITMQNGVQQTQINIDRLHILLFNGTHMFKYIRYYLISKKKIMYMKESRNLNKSTYTEKKTDAISLEFPSIYMEFRHFMHDLYEMSIRFVINY